MSAGFRASRPGRRGACNGCGPEWDEDQPEQGRRRILAAAGRSAAPPRSVVGTDPRVRGAGADADEGAPSSGAAEWVCLADRGRSGREPPRPLWQAARAAQSPGDSDSPRYARYRICL